MLSEFSKNEKLSHLKEVVATIGRLSDLRSKLCDGLPWQELNQAGLTVEAIKAYRREHDCTLMEAKNYIDSVNQQLKST